jgi:type I restriction enzyme S subunit
MVGDWIEVSVEDIKAPSANSLATGPFGSSISSRFFQDSGIPVIRGSNLSEDIDKRLVYKDTVFVSEEKAQKFSRSIVRRGDLVFTCWGTIGQVGLIDERSRYPEYVISNKQMKLSPDPERVDSLFLYYLFSGSEMSSRIKNQAIGSSVPGFNLGQLRNLKFLLPPLDEQKKIAYVIGTLDNKIELNQQMNRTLEGIARALFKSWFIDFDPVCAKLDGRQPYGMDAETAALFPDSFDDSPLGKIPKGWRVGRLDDLIILQRGFDLPKTNRTSGKYPVLAASGPSGTHNEYKVKGPGVTTGRSGVLGNIFFVHEDFWPLNTSLWVKEFRESRPIHTYYVLQDLNLEVFNAGSAVPTLNRNHVHGLKVVIPLLPVIEVFESLVMLIFQKKKANDEESIDISAVRDVLLPKLLSGEIRVKDAEQALEVVA